MGFRIDPLNLSESISRHIRNSYTSGRTLSRSCSCNPVDGKWRSSTCLPMPITSLTHGDNPLWPPSISSINNMRSSCWRVIATSHYTSSRPSSPCVSFPMILPCTTAITGPRTVHMLPSHGCVNNYGLNKPLIQWVPLCITGDAKGTHSNVPIRKGFARVYVKEEV